MLDPAGPRAAPAPAAVVARAGAALHAANRPGLRRVVNATGIVLHTNLGRAPLAPEAIAAVADAASGYCNLEFDLDAGARGARTQAVEPLLCTLTGAEAAAAVNNGAAATLLALAALAEGGEVIVSRGELVEIGGGFRIPDVIRQGGARLVEVGTTNKTRLDDYRRAITPATRVLLKVHQSNFQIVGFTQATPLAALAALARETGLLLVDDAGSGTLTDLRQLGRPAEPTVQDSLAAGSDLVVFSGDKLMGGPQAGLLVGRAAVVDRLRRHPLMRALRLDKMTLAALEATLRLHRDRGPDAIPVLRILGQTEATLTGRAERLAALLGPFASVVASTGLAGGGYRAQPAHPEPRSLPGTAGPVARLAGPAVAAAHPRGGRAHRRRLPDPGRAGHGRWRHTGRRRRGRGGAGAMRRVIGVVGHVDHGKTALVRALTGTDTDRLPEEKRRGISIALGFAHLARPGVELDFIDMPGHERFVRTMVSGATGIDAVAVVVAANEGIKPQTVEHLDIVGLLGIRRAVIAVSKADLASPGQAKAVGAEAAALATRAGLQVAAMVPTSATTGEGLAALSDALASLAGEPEGEDAGFPYLPIDRVFTIAGHGTVVTGTLRRGGLSVDDLMTLLPSGRPVRLRTLQVHGQRVASAQPGQRVAANLRDIEPSDIRRGDALAPPGLLPMSHWMDVSVRLVDSAPALRTNSVLNLLFGTEEIPVRLRLLDRDEAVPGQQVVAQLHCETAVAIPARERFILRRASPACTVAGGVLLAPATARLRRHDPATLRRLSALAQATPEEAMSLTAVASAATGVPLSALAQLAGVSPARATGWLGRGALRLTPSGVVLAEAEYARLLDAVLAILAAEPSGRTLAQLLAARPGAGAAVLETAVADLASRGLVQQAGGIVRLPQPDQDAARAGQEALAAHRLAEILRAGGLSPPDPAVAAPDAASRRLLDRLVKQGAVIRTRDKTQNRDVLFHRDAIAEAQRRLAPLLAPPGLLLGEASAALGISRKYSLPLLEHLDSIRFTRRVADRRVLARPPPSP